MTPSRMEAAPLGWWLQHVITLCFFPSVLQKSYYSRLEAAVMWLVGVCAVVAVFQLAALAYWKPAWRD